MTQIAGRSAWDVATTDDRYKLSREEVQSGRSLRCLAHKAAMRLEALGCNVIATNRKILVFDAKQELQVIVSIIRNGLERHDINATKQELAAIYSAFKWVATWQVKTPIPIFIGVVKTLRSISEKLSAQQSQTH